MRCMAEKDHFTASSSKRFTQKFTCKLFHEPAVKAVIDPKTGLNSQNSVSDSHRKCRMQNPVWHRLPSVIHSAFRNPNSAFNTLGGEIESCLAYTQKSERQHLPERPVSCIEAARIKNYCAAAECVGRFRLVHQSSNPIIHHSNFFVPRGVTAAYRV